MFVASKNGDGTPPTFNENMNDPEKKSDKSATSRYDVSQDILQATTGRTKGPGPTIIFCCPNAGYYECLHYEVIALYSLDY